MLTLNDAIAKKMEDPEFKAEWDALEPEFQIIRAIIEGREENDFTQAQLAQATPASIRPTSADWRTEPETRLCAPSSGSPPAWG